MAHLRKLLGILIAAFWVVPALLIVCAMVLAIYLVGIDRAGTVPQWLLELGWLYDGGATGARTLLGAVASSMIGVAGTVFSITIAALTLAAGQMGPRLLRNFTHDRQNQVTLGVFLGTFCYALIVLRSVHALEEGDFVPRLAMAGAMLLAFACVALLVAFVGHMAERINVDTVIALVSGDVRLALERLSTTEAPTPLPPAMFWFDAEPVADPRHGYLQNVDHAGLARWAAAHGTTLYLLLRPGSYVFPGAPIALCKPNVEGIAAAVQAHTALGHQRVSSEDPEFAVRQLVEVAVRALSPGINDPHTAIAVLDQLGTALCLLVGRDLPTVVLRHEERLVLVADSVDYDGLVDAMFHMIRQDAGGCAAVLIRMIEVLAAVGSVEQRPDRMQCLRRHAALVLADAERTVATPADCQDLQRRYAALEAMLERGPIGYLSARAG